MPAAAALAVVSALFATEAIHLRHLKRHAQAALDEAVADVALRRMETADLEETMRMRAPGRLERVMVVPLASERTTAVAELILPSAWPGLKSEGYREVLTSTVIVQLPRG